MRPAAALRELDVALGLALQHRHKVGARIHARLLYNRSSALFSLGAYEEAHTSLEEYAALQADMGHEMSGEDAYNLVLLAYLAGDHGRARQLLPYLDQPARQTLAARLQDPDFFLTETELRAQMARAGRK